MANTSGVLFKYCPIEEAKALLEGRSLRWRASHLIDNPFEMTISTPLRFNQEQLLNSAIKTATNFIFTKEAPKGGSPLMAAIRRWRDEERFGSPEEAEGVLRDLMMQMIEQRKEALDKTMAEWKLLARRVRVCDFTAKGDNFYAWSQLAEEHRGVILRFQSDGSEMFGKAEPIHYSDLRPEITPLKDQLAAILNGDKVEPKLQFLDKYYIKPTALKFQQGIRCLFQQNDKETPIDDAPANWFIDREWGEDDLTGVQFGFATPLAEKQSIWDQVKQNFTGVKLFETKLLPGKFELEVERITEKPA
ncbi:hypothetical protein [Aurantivibrio plasticivorans]